MIFPLVACNKSDNNSSKISKTEVINTKVIQENKVVEIEEKNNEGFVYWTEGEWEFIVDTPIAKFTVPTGMKYNVKSDYISDDWQTATIELWLQPLKATQFWSIRITNQWMVDSYEKAIEHTIALQNLDTYDNGTFELLDEVEYAGIKYQTIKISTEWGMDYLLAGYKWWWEIVVKIPEKDWGFTIDSDEIKSLMKSLSLTEL